MKQKTIKKFNDLKDLWKMQIMMFVYKYLSVHDINLKNRCQLHEDGLY